MRAASPLARQPSGSRATRAACRAEAPSRLAAGADFAAVAWAALAGEVADLEEVEEVDAVDAVDAVDGAAGRGRRMTMVEIGGRRRR